MAKWCPECDRRLHRLVSYLQTTREVQQYAYVGDNFLDCKLALFCDADFAGDKSDSRSTSGVFLAAVGISTFVPIIAISKKQSCVSTSTCESEVVAMSLGVKEALPVLNLWEAVEHLFRGGQPLPVPTTRSFSVESDVGGVGRKNRNRHL